MPDETGGIANALIGWADGESGRPHPHHRGTGLTPRDVTPEATTRRAGTEAPGIAEALRIRVLSQFPRAALSRGVAGVRGRTLIVNLPGSTGGVKDGLEVLEQWITRCELVRGERTDHGELVRPSAVPPLRPA